jgi:hypothetical protein
MTIDQGEARPVELTESRTAAGPHPTSPAWLEDHRHDRTCYWVIDQCRWSCQVLGAGGAR